MTWIIFRFKFTNLLPQKPRKVELQIFTCNLDLTDRELIAKEKLINFRNS